MTLSLRNASHTDLAFCESLYIVNMASHYLARCTWDPRRFRASWNQFENFMILADDEVTGFMRLMAVKDALEIRDLQLLPAQRSKGIGAWAIAQAKSEAVARRIALLRLRVFEENPAKRLYARLGFKVDAIVDGKVHMSLDLAGGT